MEQKAIHKVGVFGNDYPLPRHRKLGYAAILRLVSSWQVEGMEAVAAGMKGQKVGQPPWQLRINQKPQRLGGAHEASR